MRVVKPEQLAAEFGRLLFGHPVVRRPHQKAPPRPFFGGVRQRDSGVHAIARADERAAALVWIGLLAVAPDRGGHAGTERERPPVARGFSGSCAVTHRPSRTIPTDIFPRRPGI